MTNPEREQDMTEEHQSALDLRIVNAVQRLKRVQTGSNRFGTLCADVADFLNQLPATNATGQTFDGLSEADIVRAFKRPDKSGTPAYLRSIGHYNMPPEYADMEPEALRRHVFIEQPPQPRIFYLGEVTFSSCRAWNPRAPYNWLHDNLLSLSNQHPQGLPFTILYDAMEADGVAEHAPGYPIQLHELADILDFARVVMVMEKGDEWPMMEYANDIPLPSATADPRQIERVWGVRWKPGSYLDIPSRDRLKVILCRSCADMVEDGERHDNDD